VCYSQYEGDACEKLVVTTTASIDGGVGGFGSDLNVPETPAQISLGGVVVLPPSVAPTPHPVATPTATPTTADPTPAPTEAPTREPLIVPAVAAKVSFSGVSEEEFTKKNDDGVSLEDVLVDEIAKSMNVDTSKVRIVSIEIEQAARNRRLLAPGDLIIIMEIRKPEAAEEEGFSLESFQAQVEESLQSFDTAVVETFVVENINEDAAMGSIEATVSEIEVPDTDSPTFAPTPPAPTGVPTSSPTGVPTSSPLRDPTTEEPTTEEPTEEDDFEGPVDAPSGGSQVGPSQLLKIWAVYGACVALFSMLSNGAAVY